MEGRGRRGTVCLDVGGIRRVWSLFTNRRVANADVDSFTQVCIPPNDLSSIFLHCESNITIHLPHFAVPPS
jgi:hypothetical protein